MALNATSTNLTVTPYQAPLGAPAQEQDSPLPTTFHSAAAQKNQFNLNETLHNLTVESFNNMPTQGVPPEVFEERDAFLKMGKEGFLKAQERAASLRAAGQSLPNPESLSPATSHSDTASLPSESASGVGQDVAVDVLPPAQSDKPAPVMTPLEIQAPPVVKARPFHVKYGFALNAATITLITLAGAIANRYLHNDEIGTKITGKGLALLVNLVASNVITHMLKGNVRHVDSQLKQAGVLGAHMAMTVAADSLAEAMVGTSGKYISPTTMIGGAAALAHVAKILAYTVMGKKTHYSNEGTEEAFGTTKTRKILNAVSVGVFSTAMAAAHHFVKSDSIEALILSSSYSTMINKFGKAGLSVESSKKLRLAVVTAYVAIAALSSACVGAIIPRHAENNVGFGGKAANILYHYFGPVTAIALSSYATNLLIRACQKPKKAAVATEGAPKQPKKKPSLVKRIIDWSLLTITTAAATAMRGVNRAAMGDSPVVDLAIKNCQVGYGFHSARETAKPAKTLKDRLVAASGWLTIGFAADIIGHYVDPTRKGEPLGSFSSAYITCGTVATFAGKLIRNHFLPKPIAA